MLRITIVDSPIEQRLVLYGKLVGPWIGELQRVWENLRQQLGNRRSVIDLNEVTLIDDSADQLLATMLERGAGLAARSMANRWLIQALKAGKTRLAVRSLRPRVAVFSHTLDTGRSEGTTIAEGTATLEEVRAHLRREQSDSALPYRELIDARNAAVRLSSSELRQIVEL